MKKLKLEIEGMKCEGCANAVRAALDGVDGGRRVEVSLDEGRAEVVGEDRLDPDDLVAAVEQAGYGAAAS